MPSLKDFEICDVLLAGSSFEEIFMKLRIRIVVVEVGLEWETCDRNLVGIYGVNMEIFVERGTTL